MNLSDKSILGQLMEKLPQIGQVTWIGIRPVKRGELSEVNEVQADTQEGLIGDHYQGSSGNRQVTLIQAEHIQAIASMLHLEYVHPALLRRNIVVRGINLLALKDRQFQIGEAILETTGLCMPCSRMEENLGAGGYNAVRGHGGLTARVIQGGWIRLGDEVKLYVNP